MPGQCGHSPCRQIGEHLQCQQIGACVCVCVVCRVVFEQCLAHWERINSRAMTLLPPAAVPGRKKQQQQLQVNSQGQPDWDAEQVRLSVSPAMACVSPALWVPWSRRPDRACCRCAPCGLLPVQQWAHTAAAHVCVGAHCMQVEEVVQQAQRCAQSFAALVELTKKHKTRNQLLGTAVKNGGAFVELMVKANDFWYAYYIAAGKPFQQLVKTVQKGTKVMQVCSSKPTLQSRWCCAVIMCLWSGIESCAHVTCVSAVFTGVCACRLSVRKARCVAGRVWSRRRPVPSVHWSALCTRCTACSCELASPQRPSQSASSSTGTLTATRCLHR